MSRIKKDAEFNSASFSFMTLFYPSRCFRDIERFFADVQQLIFQKTVNISKTAIRIKKVSRIKKTRNWIHRLFYTWHILIRVAVFEILSVFCCWCSATHFPKNAQYLENSESDKKKVLRIKKTRNWIPRLFIFDFFFYPSRRFRDIGSKKCHE